MEMKERRVASDAGNDLPVSTPEEDRYGFSSLAENLAHSILSLDAGVSTVIGIEGPWGAGKTSLLISCAFAWSITDLKIRTLFPFRPGSARPAAAWKICCCRLRLS